MQLDFIDKNKVMTATETAEYLRTSVGVIYNYVSTGKLPKHLYTKLGKKLLFHKDRVVQFLFPEEASS